MRVTVNTSVVKRKLLYGWFVTRIAMMVVFTSSYIGAHVMGIAVTSSTEVTISTTAMIVSTSSAMAESSSASSFRPVLASVYVNDASGVVRNPIR